MDHSGAVRAGGGADPLSAVERRPAVQAPEPEEAGAHRGAAGAAGARTNLEKLRQTAPQWYPLAAYLSGKGFDLYRNTALRYLPTGEAYLEDMLTTLDTAQRFIFLEYFIMAEGEIWDRLSDILCRKSRQGVCPTKK